MRLKFLIFISLLCLQANGLNILAVWPVVSRTHFILGMELFNKLAENGHTITLISAFEQRAVHKNIKLEKIQGVTETSFYGGFSSLFEMRNLSVNEMLKTKFQIGAASAEYALNNEKMKDILRGNEKYDAFIYDAYYNDALLGIPYHLKIPTIAFSCLGPHHQINEMVRNPTNPSYDLNMLLGLSDVNTILNRIQNTAATIAEFYHYHFTYLPEQNIIFKEHFSDILGDNPQNIIDLVHNVDLVLVNSHPLIHSPRVHPPNSIEIGGIQLKTQEQEIHQDLNNIMNKAIYGIIYFSLGGNVRSTDLPKEKLDIFINVFTSLKAKDIVVLWKYEGIDLKERQPHNVVIGPWLPQQEILAHKNLKAFITHGGLLSLMEAVHYAKPVIGIPIFNDQKYNMARAESQGYGIQLDYDSLTEDILRTAIDKIFNDTSYRDNAERMAEHIKDSPIKAIDKAAWYVEYVIKTNGANHLKIAATMLSFWRVHFIDQILFALTCITTAIITLLSIMKYSKLKFQKRTKYPQRTIKGKAAMAVQKNKFKSN